MKRLKNILMSMDINTATYTEMYNGRISIIDPKHPGMPAFADENPTYYNGEIGFEIRGTHKLAQDMPTITIMIPYDSILSDQTEGAGDETEVATKTEEDMSVHRFKYVIQQREQNIMAEQEENQENFTVYARAAADFCLRTFGRYIDELNAELYHRSRPDKENGKYYLCRCGGEVLERNAAYFVIHTQKDYRNGNGITVYLLDDGVARPLKMFLCLKLQVQLPEKKMRKTIQMLCKDLPDAVERFVAEFDLKGLSRALVLAEKQDFIRKWLKNSDYCAFLANGSILPRAKEKDLPLPGAVPFYSAAGDEIEICGIRGMGMKKGVTVLTGGGYSGKSTLLDAISAGIYNHVQGDGRELCITDETAVTISAEEGRSVKHINISPFIKYLAHSDAGDFSTEHASGSTSQAANVMEAVDSGAGLLLIDEDRSAANFMIRDRMMKELIAREPITPFTDRVRELYHNLGVSTVLVIGGSGEYMWAADRVYQMEDYRIFDVTMKAREICRRYGAGGDNPPPADWKQQRFLYAEGFTSFPEGSKSEKLQVSDMGVISIGDEKIDIRGLRDIVSPRQLNALAFMLRYLEIKNIDREIDLRKKIDELYERIQEEGLDFLYTSYFTTCERFLDLPRRQELYALINRMRNIYS